MGSAMARNLLAAGYAVTAYDVDAAKLDEMAAAGAQRAGSAAELPAAVDVIILSLPNTQAVRTTIEQTMDLPARARRGLVILDTSTIDDAVSAQIAARLRPAGVEFLDAPVSGTPDMCAVRENVVLVGGDRATFERCMPLFAAMSKEAVHIGANGSALVLKLVVNLVLALHRMALAEGLTLAAKAGLDPAQTLDVLKRSAAYSKAMDQKGERMVNRRFLPPIARIAITYKDLRFILALGEKLDCPLPLSALNAQALASEIAKGRGDRDSADIISFYDDLANIHPPGASAA
jgi:3-hydroxyisobutyrate dehydrogenase-like beta-hydroxyacid dehydrogenase